MPEDLPWPGMVSYTRRVMMRASARAALAATAALAALGCFLLPDEEEVLSPDLLQAPQITFRTVVAELGAIERKTIVTGQFVYREQHPVFFRDRAGPLRALHVDWGDAVEAGQLLAELDTAALLDRIALQELDLRRAELLHQRALATDADRFTVALAGLDLERARLLLSQLEDELGRSRLFAPIAGRVVYVASVQPGEQVAAFRTVVQVADPSDLVLSYHGQQRRDFVAGTAVSVVMAGDTYAGEVIATPASAPPDATDDEAARVLIRVDGLPARVTAGASAVVHLVLERREGVVVVPRSVVETYVNRTYVQVLEDGLPVERDVEVGIETPTRVEIRTGLSAGEAVVLR